MYTKYDMTILQQIQQMQNQFMQQNTQSQSPSQLKLSIKQNEIMINILSKQIKKKQNEMKQFSEDMTKMIQKKLIVKNQSQYSHPNFNPVYSTPHLQQLHKQKQQIYSQIKQLKNSISMIVSQQQPQIANEYHKKQSIIAYLEKQGIKLEKQKSLLEESMIKNKDVLEGYKNSQCLKEIQENQVQLEAIKKQIRDLDKDIKMWSNQEIYMSLYTDTVNQDIQWMENQQEQEEPVQKNIIDGVIADIHTRIEEKKMIDREFIAKKQQINRKIKETTAENARLQKQIREIRNIQIQKQLQKKKKQILSRNNSLPQMMSSTPNKKPRNPVSITPTLHLPKSKLMHKIQKKPASDTIYIGVWKEQNLIKDDIIQKRNISRAIGLKIRVKDRKLVGVGATYIDKVGVQVHGRSNIWKISDDALEDGQQQMYIDLEDVVSIYYNSTGNNQSNTVPIGLKFLSKTSRPIIKVGEILNQQEVQFIDLENKFIKTVQFTLDNNYKSISGIKLTICNVSNETVLQKPKLKNQSIFESEHELEQHNTMQMDQSNNKNEDLMPGKWLSTTSQGRLMQNHGNNKKVFLKNANKKLNQIPQVDHRLMLNRKKKMV